MFEFADILLQKRQFVIAGIAIIINLQLICLLSPIAQTYRANVATAVRTSYASQLPESTYNSSNVMTSALSQMAADIKHGMNTVETGVLSGVILVATGITRFDKDTVHSAQVTIAFTLHSVTKSVSAIGHTVGRSFAFMGHLPGRVFGLSHGLIHPSSLIRPQDNTPTPVITKLEAQQAALIQSNTMSVLIASLTSSGGGLCDNGSGNGGYPVSWCNAPMDSIPTLSFSKDPINRECTSYADWYFTIIEGHTDFRAYGNAKYWAATSNYQTGITPAIGAIAVETAGAYGHVAIVQALSGQKYAGQVVPAGYVLVSEMNYDWHGHFRYSYSPLSKFSAYIYP